VDAVVDTTVLIALARLERLDLLSLLYERVFAPHAVQREALVHPARPDTRLIREALAGGSVELVDPPDRAPRSPELAGLGAGETAAIAAAHALGAVVVLDDRRARRAAVALGLDVIGSVGLLIEARRRGLIAAAEPLVRELQAAGFRIGPDELEAARAADLPP